MSRRAGICFSWTGINALLFSRAGAGRKIDVRYASDSNGSSSKFGLSRRGQEEHRVSFAQRQLINCDPTRLNDQAPFCNLASVKGIELV
jgi:hypothetical protein